MKNIYKEFREFAVKGNMVDMAIGIIIGTAFSAIVNSLVKDIVMPLFGFMTGDIDLSTKKYVLQEAEIDTAGKTINEAIAISYGKFLGVCLDFFIIAASIFMVIKLINSLKRKAEDPEEPSAPTPKNIELLSEIRDLLKEKQLDK